MSALRFLIALPKASGAQGTPALQRARTPSTAVTSGVPALWCDGSERPLQAGRLTVIGTLFDRRATSGLHRIPEAVADQILASPAALIDDYWGPYLAVIGDGDGSISVVRDPSGALPCYVMDTAAHFLLASDLGTFEAAGTPAGGVQWDRLFEHLQAIDIRRVETCVEGISELPPGGVTRFVGANRWTTHLWRPWPFTSPAARLDRAAAPAILRDVICTSVSALASPHRHILVGLSGGLDSSIVCAALAAGGHDFACLTMATEDASGDERPYAKLVAEATGARLLEHHYDTGKIDLARSASAHLPRPGAKPFMQEIERAYAQALSAGHPDTLRRVQTISSEEELRLALDFPWDKWSVFLHPSQREIADKDFSGPARVTGTAGTGKTIVALHRAARAVRNDPQARVLLTTFSRPLASALQPKLRVLLGDDPALIGRINVASFEDAASELYQLATARKPILASADIQQIAVERALAKTGYSDLPARFVLAEWRQVVDAWNLRDPESYTNVPRIGRRGRLGAKQREALWPVFEAVRDLLTARSLLTLSQLYATVEDAYADRPDKPFTHIVIDEAQDLGVGELRMMSGLASGPNALFFAGDLGQRIFQLPFSWLALGVDVRGRSSGLKINYRTSRQIRETADQLLPRKVRDADGIEDDRTDAQSVFEGPPPTIAVCADESIEIAKVADFIRASVADGAEPSEIGVIVRCEDQLPRARAAVAAAEMEARQLTERSEDGGDKVAVGTMHLAKGLEFKAVAVMACDDETLPLQSRIDDATDEEELREVFDTERHLFYVACTRARDRLHVSGVTPVSEFLGDLGS